MSQFDTWKNVLLPVLHQPGLTVAKRAAILKDLREQKKINCNDGEPPIPGYYRAAAVKGGLLLPVAIWREGETLYVLRAGEPCDLNRVWPRCVENPVPYDWYERKTEGDGRWPDEADLTAKPATAEQGDVPAADRAVAKTDNNPPEETPFERLQREIETASGAVETYKDISSDDEAGAAQSVRARLNELGGSADKKRTIEKQPHLDACREIDAKWQPIVKMAKNAADAIRSSLGAYETKKLRAQRAAEAAAEAAKPKPEADQTLGDILATALDPKQQQPAATPAPVAAASIKGAAGRAATVRTVKVAVVEDQDAAYQHLKAIPELKSLIQKLAQRLVDNGDKVPGVRVEEERKVA